MDVKPATSVSMQVVFGLDICRREKTKTKAPIASVSITLNSCAASQITKRSKMASLRKSARIRARKELKNCAGRQNPSILKRYLFSFLRQLDRVTVGLRLAPQSVPAIQAAISMAPAACASSSKIESKQMKLKVKMNMAKNSKINICEKGSLFMTLSFQFQNCERILSFRERSRGSVMNFSELTELFMGFIIKYIHLQFISFMLEDRFPELMRSTNVLRVLVAATYQAKESLIAKGLTPAIFMHEFYQKKSPQDVVYMFKEKQIRALCDIAPIDIEQYNHSREDIVHRNIKQAVSTFKFRPPKHVTHRNLQNRTDIQSHLNNINFHWFESANKVFLHAAALEDDNNMISTLHQPFAVTYLLEVDNRSCRENFEKVRKEAEAKLKKLFILNAGKLRTLPLMVVVFFDVTKDKTYQHAKAYADVLKNEFNVEPSLICLVEINGPLSEGLTCWSNYPRPIFNIDYRLQPLDPIHIISPQQMNRLTQITEIHKARIKSAFETRFDYLMRRYEQSNTAKNKFINFFKSSTPIEKKYVEEEAETREIADNLLLLEDYKRAHEVYKNLLDKMSGRQKSIEHNISEQIQLCLVLSKAHGVKITNDHFASINKHSEFMLKNAQALGKNKLIRYLMMLIYIFHSFKVFEKDFIRPTFYYYLKMTLSEEKVSLMPCLIHEQFASINLLYPEADVRRYCYDLVRVATRFNESKLYNHCMRCLLIVDNIYKNTFPIIEKYVNLQLSRAYLEIKDYPQSLERLKHAWLNLLTANEQDSSLKTEVEDSDFCKMLSNHQKILLEIEKNIPDQLQRPITTSVPIPLVRCVNLELPDQFLSLDQRTGTKWMEIGDSFLSSTELISKRIIKASLINILKHFDSVSTEEKELAYRVKLELQHDENGIAKISDLFLKKNCRTCYANQPITITFEFINTLPNTVEVENITLLFNMPPSSYTIESKKSTGDIKPFQRKLQEFIFTPTQAGLFELKEITWVFARMKSCFLIKQPVNMLENHRTFYYKLNVIKPSARLVVSFSYPQNFCEGEITQLEVTFFNEGVQAIDNIYFAVGQSAIFPFKMYRFQFGLAPKQKRIHKLQVQIPLVPQSIKSGKWRHVSKGIFLYRSTSELFRTVRTLNVLNISKIVELKNIVCEKLSNSIHLLTFSTRYLHKDFTDLVKSLFISSNLDIKKVESTQANEETKYFFFLRKNTAKQLEQYRISRADGDGSKLVKEVLSRNQAGKAEEVARQSLKEMQLALFWEDSGCMGVIQSNPIEITMTQNSLSKIKLPFGFKIQIVNEADCHFLFEGFLETDVTIVVKNIFTERDISLTINLCDRPSELSWEGAAEQKVTLKQNQSCILVLKLLVFRPGIFDLAQSIRYKMEEKYFSETQFTHSEYENIYLSVKDVQKPVASGKPQLVSYDLI